MRNSQSRFLFISTNHGSGASEELWVQTAGILARRGHSVFAIAPWGKASHPNSRVSHLESAGVNYHSFSATPFSIRLPSRLQQSLWTRNLKKCIAQAQADLIIISNGTLQDSLIVRDLPHLTEVPFITLDHGVFEANWPDDKCASLLAELYLQAKNNHFVSRASKELAECQLGATLRDAQVVFNPFLVPRDIRIPWPENKNEIRLANVARLYPRAKGQDILLRMLALEKWRSRPLHVSIYGSGPNQETLKRESQRLGLDAITFHGQVKDIGAIWEDHHALILPSRQENMPLSIVEAMHCARPCIATSVGGIPEIISDGENGFLVPAATLESLDQTMEKAWGVRSDWSKIGLAAASSIRRVIPSDPVAHYADILNKIVQSSRNV